MVCLATAPQPVEKLPAPHSPVRSQRGPPQILNSSQSDFCANPPELGVLSSCKLLDKGEGRPALGDTSSTRLPASANRARDNARTESRADENRTRCWY